MANGTIVSIVTRNPKIIRCSVVSIATNTINRIWMMNTRATTIMYITAWLVWLVIQAVTIRWHLIIAQKDTNKVKVQTSGEVRPLYPKTNTSWNQVQLFLERLNDLANGNYLLPTVSEWEYACLKIEKSSQGNFSGKQGSDKWLSIAPVNAFPTGQISIADLKGNTWEWTNDTYAKPNQNAIFQWLDAFGKTPSMILKGGSFDSPASTNSCFTEMKLKPKMSMIDIGFRLVWEPGS